jgi:hypothetical protein
MRTMNAGGRTRGASFVLDRICSSRDCSAMRKGLGGTIYLQGIDDSGGSEDPSECQKWVWQAKNEMTTDDAWRRVTGDGHLRPGQRIVASLTIASRMGSASDGEAEEAENSTDLIQERAAPRCRQMLHLWAFRLSVARTSGLA